MKCLPGIEGATGLAFTFGMIASMGVVIGGAAGQFLKAGVRGHGFSDTIGAMVLQDHSFGAYSDTP